jgi:phosphonate degradation associated HDIG domain protein
MNLFEDLADLFERKGSNAYLGEPVSQEEHALQAAWLAERDGASDALVVAALLHDIGHFLDDIPEDLAEQGIDGRHEAAGSSWLSRVFGPEVIDPVRLHVPAKRYLCATEPTYLAGLSPASRLSLQLQGGPFTSDEIRRFEAEPYHRAAVRLRRWDDAAKIPGLLVPGLDHYRDRIEALTFADASPEPTANRSRQREASP